MVKKHLLRIVQRLSIKNSGMGGVLSPAHQGVAWTPARRGVAWTPTRRGVAWTPTRRGVAWANLFAREKVVIAAILLLFSASLQAASFDNYQQAGSFVVPENTHTYDVLNDGRMILLVDDVVWIESAVSSRIFIEHGTLVGADIPSFGAAFIDVSPDGSKIAVGNNGSSTSVDYRVGILDFNTLSGTWFAADHFAAHWMDNTNLMLAVSDFSNGSSISVLDTTSVDANSPDNVTIIQNIGGASGGVAIDDAGRLFTGNGYTSIGPSDSGNVKAFEKADWSAALSGGTAPDFEADGTFVIDVLGASPLGFDNAGNLFVGGGGTAPDSDSIALVRASAIATVLGGGSPIDTFDSSNVRRFDPIPDNNFNFYSANYNPVTGEIYVRDFDDTTIYIYRASSFATYVVSYDPAPGQYVNNEAFNDPIRALGAPIGGGISDANQSSIVSLGAFGGSITLGFDQTVTDDPLNPFGMDAIVFSNAFWSGSNPNDHWAECATIEISVDANNNGQADDAWYLIPGSHILNPQDQWSSATWDTNFSNDTYPPMQESWLPPGSFGTWSTYAYELPAKLFAPVIVHNPGENAEVESIFGYAEYTPTLLLGDLDADNIIDDLAMTSEEFYTVPDDPFTIGISSGSGGGDAFDIAWAINPLTGEAANLSGFDFIRLTTAVYVDLNSVGPIGEKSAEIDAVADVTPDPFGDFDDDSDIDLFDIAEMQNCFGVDNPDKTACRNFDRENDNEVALDDASAVIQRLTGPR